MSTATPPRSDLRNQTLHYRLLADHLTELLPVVYDPLVALALEQFSHVYQRPDGVYLSVDDVDGVEEALRNYGLGAEDVDRRRRRLHRRHRHVRHLAGPLHLRQAPTAAARLLRARHDGQRAATRHRRRRRRAQPPGDLPVRATGMPANRVEKPDDVPDAVRDTLAATEPALLDVVTDPNALEVPPRLTAEQTRNFALAVGKVVLGGGVGDMVELARTNLRNIPVSPRRQNPARTPDGRTPQP